MSAGDQPPGAAMTRTGGPDDDETSLRHLLARLAYVETRVRTLVATRRADDPAPDDPFRGLYLSAEAVEALLARGDSRVAVPSRLPPREVEDVADRWERDGAALRLRSLAEWFGLDDLDVELLLVALAPDLDPRFEKLYGYLNDDVTRRRASVALALDLCGLHAADGDARGRFAATSALVAGGLVVVEDEDRPYLSRGLRAPDRVVAHLLGDDRADGELAGVLREPLSGPVVTTADGATRLGRAFQGGVRLCYLREASGGAGRALAATALGAAGFGVLDVDLTRLPVDADVAALARVLCREARLRGAGLVAGPVEALAAPRATWLRALGDLPVPLLLTGAASWDPAWTPTVPLVVDAPEPAPEERRALWRTHLDGQAVPGLDPVRETAHLRLGPQQIARAAQAAHAQARWSGTPVTAEVLRAGARAQNAAGLERLARRIVPAVGWSHLVLPPATLEGLRELAARARHRERVLGEWAMRPGGGRGHGVTALFTGESGTGKTTAAEVVAAELGLDLYAVDLATIVDKYVGETEKNLDRVFSEAAGVNGVLLFDEADAVFGKRSAVGDAHDRYANIESAYLLQRMESFDGLAILATNLRSNLDDAFTRRLDMVVDFPLPDQAMRLRLWDVCLGTALPRADDVDLGRCAREFELAGGDIRSAAVTAAYLAADADRPVRMADVVRAVEREYAKLGRLHPAGLIDR